MPSISRHWRCILDSPGPTSSDSCLPFLQTRMPVALPCDGYFCIQHLMSSIPFSGRQLKVLARLYADEGECPGCAHQRGRAVKGRLSLIAASGLHLQSVIVAAADEHRTTSHTQAIQPSQTQLSSLRQVSSKMSDHSFTKIEHANHLLLVGITFSVPHPLVRGPRYPLQRTQSAQIWT